MTNNQSNSSAANGICPFCKNKKAYQGLSHWECPNTSCKAFSPKQKELIDEEERTRQIPPREYTAEELERKAEEDELERELKNYGNQIWGYQVAAGTPIKYVPGSATMPIPTPKNSAVDTDDDQAKKQLADLLKQLDLLYPNH